MQPAETVGNFLASWRSPSRRPVRVDPLYRYPDRLRALAKTLSRLLRLERRIGHFVPEGWRSCVSTRGDRMTAGTGGEFLAAVDIGPSAPSQQDVEFGMVQIVDVALRAISAVNDPTTATCVDQLSTS